ncbi:MAG TPA: adenylate/guanylate cyclase domain-containing protein, partial [Allosphingosinicella sp.]
MGSCAGDSRAAILFSRDLVAELLKIEAESGIPFQVRIGIHTGPAVGGVIGSSRLAYDYWGDTLNIASRLQSVAPLNGIAVSESTYFQTRMIQDYEPLSVILKGIGETAAYAAKLGGGETPREGE